MAALVSLVSLLGWLTWRWTKQSDIKPVLPFSLVWSLIASLFAYGLMSLTDYQLDTLAIGGVLIVYLVVLAKIYQAPSKPTLSHGQTEHSLSRIWVGLGIGLTLAINLWLIPIHKAWALSKQGFQQLERGNFDGFENALTQAHQLAPWEPYYPSMLAWALGDFSSQTTGESSDALRTAAIKWFENVNTVAPYQEFGQSNLGWLFLQTDPEQAVAAFVKAATLIPTKQGVFFGFGQALLANGQPQLAIDAFALEMFRFPMVMTSPIWEISELNTLRDDILSQLEELYSQLLATADDQKLRDYGKQMRGIVHWWQRNYAVAAQDWKDFPTGQTLLRLVNNNITAETLPTGIIGRSAILAWLSPAQRVSIFERASIQTNDQLPQLNTASPLPELVDQLVITIERANSFDDWLKNNMLISQPRSQRLGFGVLNRHIDGPFPSDYYIRIVNQPINLFFKPLFLTPTWTPELDKFLQPYREQLLKTVSES